MTGFDFAKASDHDSVGLLRGVDYDSSISRIDRASYDEVGAA